MRARSGILSQIQRRWAWVTFFLLAAYAPVVAVLLPDDTWLLSVTVAALVAFVIIVDDTERRRVRGDDSAGV